MSQAAIKEEPAKERRALQVAPNAMQLREYNAVDFRLVAPADMLIEDLLLPDCWAHVAQKFDVGQNRKGHFPTIEVIWEDGTRYVRLLVLSYNSNSARVAIIQNTPLVPKDAKIEKQAEPPIGLASPLEAPAEPKQEETQPTTGKVKDLPPAVDGAEEDNPAKTSTVYTHNDFRVGFTALGNTKAYVNRVSDNKRMIDGLDNVEAAREWLDDFIKAQ